MVRPFVRLSIRFFQYIDGKENCNIIVPSACIGDVNNILSSVYLGIVYKLIVVLERRGALTNEAIGARDDFIHQMALASRL